MRFRFVHAADLHLDTPFQGIRRIHPDLATTLQNASLQAFDNLIDVTIEKQADFLLLAGDIYDGASRDLRAQFRFQAGLQRLHEHNIPAFVIHGNHDPLNGKKGWPAIRDWTPNVTIFESDKVQNFSVEKEGHPIATIYGISYAQREMRDNLAQRYQRADSPGLHIGLLHCTVNANATNDHEPYAPCTEEDLCSRGMGYWALGHIHKRRAWQRDNTWIAYSGNTQGRHTKASEMGAKGALVVECEDEHILHEPTFVPIDTVRFIKTDVDVSTCTDISHIRDRLLEQGDALRQREDNRSLLIQATLTGRTRLTRDLRNPDTFGKIINELNSEATTGGTFMWWDRLHNETRPPIEHSSLRERSDFKGELARLVDNLKSNPTQLQAFMEKHLTPTSPPTIRALFDDTTYISALLDSAEVTALDFLEDD